MNNENPYRDTSKTLRADVVLMEISRVRKGPVLKQSQPVKIPMDALYQKLDLNVNLETSHTINGYKSALAVTCPYSFKLIFELDGNRIEQICTGVYTTVGSFEGTVTIEGLEEDYTRCSVITA